MKDENQKKGSGLLAFTVFALIFLVIYVIVNIGAISDVLSYVLSVLSPLLIGFALAYMLNPILRLFEFKIYKKIKNIHVLRGLSLVSTFVVALLIVVALLWLLVPQIITSIEGLVAQYDTYISKTTGFVNNLISKFMSEGHVSEYINEQHIRDFVANFFSMSGDVLDSVMAYIKEYGMGLFEGVKNTILGIFIAIYVLISKEKLQAQVKKLGAAFLPDSKVRKLGKYINITHKTFSGFFVGKIIDSAIIMVLTLILMLIFNMPYALLVSVIVGVTNIIPIFGPIVGAVPSFFIIFIVNPQKALIFIVLILLIQQLDGNVIGPMILGDSTGISSLGVIVAIVIMGDLFGVLGMIIGVPIFAVGTTVIKEIVETKLRKKNRSIDTADYYLKDAIADPHDHHEPIATRIVKNVAHMFKTIGDHGKKHAAAKQAEDKEKEERQADTVGQDNAEDGEENKDNGNS